MYLKIFACAIATLVVLSGCSDSVEPKGPDFSFGVEVVGVQGSDPLTIRANFRNSGGTKVELGGCEFMWFTVRRSDGTVVPTYDPCGPLPPCLWSTRSLRPGDAYVEDFAITGITWDGCDQIPLEPGVYGVEAGVLYRFDSDSDNFTEASVATTFKWPSE